MQGKVFIVTGSSSGIGAATAVLLASNGAKVTVHGRRPEQVAAVAQQCKEASPSKFEAFTVLGNIEDANVRTQLVQGTLKTFGRIDGLANSAGWAKIGNWQKTDLKDMQLMLDVHVLAPYDLARQVMPQLIENKGSIVMVSSASGMRGVPGIVAYVTAKHAMDGMMKALATETASLGVRVNSVNPGMADTNIRRYDDFKDFEAKNLPLDKIHPNGRLGQPSEVAQCIAFLLSDNASMVTGIEMPVDGGLTSAIFWQR